MSTEQASPDIGRLIERLNTRADIEESDPMLSDAEAQAAFEDVPEITWQELREIVGLLRESASALAALQARETPPLASEFRRRAEAAEARETALRQALEVTEKDRADQVWHLQNQLRIEIDNAQRAESAVESLRQEKAQLRAYARHKDTCPQSFEPTTAGPAPAIAWGPCDCGLSEVLK